MTVDHGKTIRNLHAQPGLQRTLHEVPRSGCCYTFANCSCCCPGQQERSYVWIGEASLETNTACFTPLDCYRCKICTYNDLISKTYYDREPFADACCGMCKTGIASQEDLSYCCYCIPLHCCYNTCVKPCCGGCLVATPCPRDTTGFLIATRCCPQCNINLMCCVDDADVAAKALQEAIENFKGHVARVENGAAPSHPATKAPGAMGMSK